MGGVVGRRRHGCPRGHPIRPQLGASTAPTEESTLETRRGCGALRPDRLGVPDGDWNRSAVHVPRDPVAGLGGLAVPATGGCTGRPARRAHRLMGGRQGRRAVRSWNAAREDAHAPGVQRDGRLLLVLLRRLGDGAEQAHQALERAAVELDARVRQRTSQLYATNLYLRNEVAEREQSEQKLRQQEAQLAEAQQVAHIGSWEWMIPQNRVSWSDEMYRIHGHVPQAFPAAFEMAVAQVNTEDAARIWSNVEEALRRADDHDLPNIEYRITRDDGVERVLLGRPRCASARTGSPCECSGPSRTSPRAGRPNASTGSPRRCSGAFCRIGSPSFPACCWPRATSRPAPTWRAAVPGTTSCNSQTGRSAWPSATWPGTGCERPRPWDSYGWACAPTRWRNRRRPRS